MARIDGLKAAFDGRWPQAWRMYGHLQERGLMSATSRLLPGGGRCGVGGVLITVLPEAVAREQARARRKRFVHRVLATCDCGAQVPFGRVQQHRKACTANVFAAPGAGQ